MTCIVDFKQQPPVLRCTVCDGTAPFSLPMSVDQVEAVGKAFERQHWGCKARSVQQVPGSDAER